MIGAAARYSGARRVVPGVLAPSLAGRVGVVAAGRRRRIWIARGRRAHRRRSCRRAVVGMVVRVLESAAVSGAARGRDVGLALTQALRALQLSGDDLAVSKQRAERPKDNGFVIDAPLRDVSAVDFAFAQFPTVRSAMPRSQLV
jgi:hypothetical protein